MPAGATVGDEFGTGVIGVTLRYWASPGRTQCGKVYLCTVRRIAVHSPGVVMASVVRVVCGELLQALTSVFGIPVGECDVVDDCGSE